MRSISAALVLAWAIAVVGGCGPRDGQPGPGEPVEGKAEDRARGEAIAAEEMPAEPEAPGDMPDDMAPRARHGLVRGLESLRDAIPTEKARPPSGLVDLQQADDLLSSARDQNVAAIREANRQVRIAGRGVNIILFVAQALRRDQLGSYGRVPTETPHIDKLAAEGVRFTDFHAEGARNDVAHWSLMTGLRAGRAPEGQPAALSPKDFTLSRVLWTAGYATGLIGDCTLGGAVPPGGATGQDFELWSGYRDSAQGCPAWPEQLWYRGSPMRVLDNADGKRAQHAADLLGREISHYVGLPRGGRPLFLYVAWPEFTGGNSGDPAAALDAALGALVERLKALGLERKTVVFLIGAGGDSRPGLGGSEQSVPPDRPEAEPAPLIVWAPQRFPPGVRDRRSTCCDILPTLADLADAHRRPRLKAGTSLVPALRGSKASN